jgi:glycosyltransferase XagB
MTAPAFDSVGAATGAPPAAPPRCGGCGRWVSPAARFCRSCGASRPRGSDARQLYLVPMPEVPSDDGSPPPTTAKRCVACRTRLSPIANFCRSCGVQQPGSTWQASLRLPRELSARTTLLPRQRRVLALVGVARLVALVLAPLAVITGLIAAATVLYLGMLWYRLRMFASALGDPAIESVTDEDARALPEQDLPVYTVLVPAYREPEVIGNLLAAIDRMDYPRGRLDVRVLLEADDQPTIEAARAAAPGSHVTLVMIPPSEPRTKPKACNVGLAGARGSFVTIYDAEDDPEPLQLRRAVAAFRRLPPDVACLQARLSYRNAEQNLLTRWFTAEYELWFGHLLPGLVARGAPLPLGGTSNHFRRERLVEVGGWDAWNVTEDADLGIRLHRLGYRTRVLDSTTLEEANSDAVNWVKQRSRWYKGYLQTWLVHMRHPRRLWQELGPAGFVGFNLFVGGTPGVALLNPVFWALTALWFLARPTAILALFPAPIYYASLCSLVIGNAIFLYTTIVGARATNRPTLVLAALVSPAYWVLMSMAVIKAAVQLVHTPTFWEKTVHGLDRPIAAPEAPDPAAA